MVGVRFLQIYCIEFDDGTRADFHIPFIRDLLTEIFRASCIVLEMPYKLPRVPAQIVSDYIGFWGG